VFLVCTSSAIFLTKFNEQLYLIKIGGQRLES